MNPPPVSTQQGLKYTLLSMLFSQYSNSKKENFVRINLSFEDSGKDPKEENFAFL